MLPKLICLAVVVLLVKRMVLLAAIRVKLLEVLVFHTVPVLVRSTTLVPRSRVRTLLVVLEKLVMLMALLLLTKLPLVSTMLPLRDKVPNRLQLVPAAFTLTVMARPAVVRVWLLRPWNVRVVPEPA